MKRGNYITAPRSLPTPPRAILQPLYRRDDVQLDMACQQPRLSCSPCSRRNVRGEPKSAATKYIEVLFT